MKVSFRIYKNCGVQEETSKLLFKLPKPQAYYGLCSNNISERGRLLLPAPPYLLVPPPYVFRIPKIPFLIL